MDLSTSDIAADVAGIALRGRLDTPGVDQVETRFTATAAGAAGGGKHVIVDLSAVEFVGSMGIRMFITVAKSLQRQKRKLVLHSAQPLVREVFETVALNDIVPVAANADAALRTVRG